MLENQENQNITNEKIVLSQNNNDKKMLEQRNIDNDEAGYKIVSYEVNKV